MVPWIKRSGVGCVSSGGYLEMISSFLFILFSSFVFIFIVIISPSDVGEWITSCLCGNAWPGIHAEQSVHAQEQEQVTAQFHGPADQRLWEIQPGGQHLAKHGC